LLVRCVRNGVESLSGYRNGNLQRFKRDRPDGTLNVGQPMYVPCKCRLGDRYTARMTSRGPKVDKDGHAVEYARFGERRDHVRQIDYRGEFNDRAVWSEAVREHILATEPDVDPTDNPFNDAI
jgi:hypothetical protein